MRSNRYISLLSIFVNAGMSYYFLLFAILTILSSCKGKQKIIKDAQKTSAPVVAADDSRIVQNLNKLVRANAFTFKTFSAKSENQVEMGDSSRNDFNASIRIRKDSAIWVSISPALGIEVARALITKDTVLLMNRINATYFAGNFSYLNQLLNTDLDYDMLEALLVGNAIDYYDDERLKVLKDAQTKSFVMSSVRKRKLKKILEGVKQLAEPLESIWIIPETYRVSRVYLDDFACNRTFDVRFQDFTTVDSMYIPQEANYVIKAEKNIFVKTRYSKISLNNELSFPFKIPEKYQPIKQRD